MKVVISTREAGQLRSESGDALAAQITTTSPQSFTSETAEGFILNDGDAPIGVVLAVVEPGRFTALPPGDFRIVEG